MKKQFRKIAMAVIFSLAAALMAPANQVALAATKTFTYAEQKTGDTVTTLVMDKGEKVDLKFMGVSNWKTYTYKWATSNSKVAVVDSAGVITAVGDGVATIKLMISGGDGTQYTSTGVTVYVGQKQSVTIGTAATAEIKSYTVEMGKSVILNANGIVDDIGDRYTFNWSSTDTSVAKVSSSGVITTVAPGLTVIQLSVTKNFSGEVMQATPIALLVTTKAAATPTPKPVATATPKPAATATPKPAATATPKPAATATPKPTAAATNGTYTVAVTSDRSVTVTFKNAVTYTGKDVEFSQVMKSGDEDILLKLDVESVTLDASKKVMTIRTQDVLTTDRYNVKIGTEEKGTTFNVKIDVPNRLEIVYSCLGKEGVAYSYDEEVALDVPVTLKYKLYYDTIDVTESYEYDGYISYELVSPTESEYVMMSGEQLYFYMPRLTAAVQANYTYYTESGAEKELKASVSIKAQSLGDYKITGVANWTIIDTESTGPIDWNNPVKSVVAGSYGHKIVALIEDSYGYYYSTDERGVDRENNIFSVEDTDTLFAMRGYSCALSPSNDTNYYIDSNGTLYTYAADSRAAAVLTLFNYDEFTSGEKKLDAWQFTILAESKLSSIQITETSTTLLTNAENNEERFCTVDVPIMLIDQYKNEWKGEPNLEVTSSSSLLNNNIDAAATVKMVDDKWVLHIDGRAIQEAGVKSSVTFYVTDADTNKKSTGIRVSLKNPADTNGNIALGTWDIGMKDAVISYGSGADSNVSAQAELEIYQLSKNGSYKVGLLTSGVTDEYGNTVDVHLQTAATYSFTKDNCKAGDIFVLVLGPDNKMVDISAGMGLGVTLEDGKVKINVTESSSNLVALPEGKYTVRVTKINKVSTTVSKTTKNTSFTVEDNTKDVAVVGYNNNRRTSETVSGVDDPALKQIVVDLFVFTLGGTKWTSLTSDMVTNVNCTIQNSNGAYRINSIEFAVPAEGDNTISYQKTVKVNQIIYTGVDH